MKQDQATFLMEQVAHTVYQEHFKDRYIQVLQTPKGFFKVLDAMDKFFKAKEYSLSINFTHTRLDNYECIIKWQCMYTGDSKNAQVFARPTLYQAFYDAIEKIHKGYGVNFR